MTDQGSGHEAPEFLTDEWVGWLDSRLADCHVGAGVDLVLEHRVTRGDGSAFCWHVNIAGGRVSAVPGSAPVGRRDRLVVFASDRETAYAIAAEGKSAQRAFAQGRLRLEGDPLLLLEAADAIAAIGTALTPPRPAT